MKTMASTCVIVVLFGILCSGTIGLAISGDETIFLSCSRIEYVHKQGMQLFDFERAKALYLAKIGYIRNATEPFAPLFLKTPLPRDTTKEFYRANQDLRGTQRLLDDFKQFNVGHLKEDCPGSQCFLNATSSCLPDYSYERLSSSNIRCNPNYKYRSFDGTCNNLKKPLIGSILTPFSRLLDPTYDDDVLEPRRSVTGGELPSAREIINEIYAENPIPVRTKPGFVPNMGFLIYGQFTVHDMASQITALNDKKSSDGAIQCCSGDYKEKLPDSLRHYACMPIDIPPNDKHFGPKNLRCHNFVRSQPAFQNDRRSSVAEQANRVTGYLDVSVIYGKTKEEANKLRVFQNGQLKTSRNNVLPVKDVRKTNSCYETGDFRVNQTPALACTHSIFVRLHNQITGTLSKMNSHWSDEKLYQEARRIVIAIHQHIIYTEYIPTLINETIDCYPPDYGYNDKIEGTAINDFSTGVFRFFHAYVPRNVETYGPDGKMKKAFQLSRIMDDTRMLERHFSDVVRGQIFQTINNWLYDDEVRNQIFNQSDLISVDIQRGRDHGIPPYYRYREICNLPPVKSFNDLYPLISHDDIENLRRVYKSVYDIDLIVGGGLERKNGLLMGPTFNCITKIQFSRLKFGDRFFYTHRNYFTTAQLNEIKKFSFAKLLALTTSVEQVPLHSFYVPSSANPLVECTSLRDFDLSPWID